VDAREIYLPMRRSLGNKRRKIGEGKDGEPDQIADIVRLFGKYTESDQSKIFDNEGFGYTRVTVERPLRLRYQMDADHKTRFLDACPELLDDVQEIDKQLGRAPLHDWNEVWKRIQDVLDERGTKWKAGEQKLFRSVFTDKDPDARPVRVGKGFEPDPDLRDFENIPLKQDVDAYFTREVLPHVPDARMDRSIDKVGYEISFNRHFYRYTPPRPLEAIDADLKKTEDEILRLLNEVTA
jgi:type I restriction enzyme M protein